MFPHMHSLFPEGKGGPVTLADLQNQSPNLFVLQKDQQSGRFNISIAMTGYKFVLRLTGGCGNMTPQYWDGLNNIIRALAGDTSDGQHPAFGGLGLFGGTRMLYKDDVMKVRPGVTEVFPAAMQHCPSARFLGVVGQVSNKLQYLPWIMVSDEGKADYFTIVHPRQTACAILTETPDQPSKSPWVREYSHCFDLVSELFQGGWEGLLMAYNGGGATDGEIGLWANAGLDNPAWRVLLVDGSGGTAEKRAQDKAWLAEHPTVHVAQNNVDSIWHQLVSLGALRA